MSLVFKNGDGPQLGPLSTGTEMLSEGKAKMVGPGKLSLTTPGGFVDLKKKSKVFSEGPNPPSLSPMSPMETKLMTPDLTFFKKPPSLPLDKTYTVGSVRQTEKEGLVDLAENLPNIKHGITGAISEEGFIPTCDQYTEGVHYVVEKNLAKGSFGTTALCVDSEKHFFRKRIKKETFRSSEVVVPANLNHENVTKLYGLIQREEADGGQTVELMIEPAGEALNTFTKNNSIDTPKIWDIAKQTMAGLNHLHLYGMIHLDVKPENICAQMKGNRLLVKITDFGSAKLPQEGIAFVGMTPEYMASELSQLFLQKSGLVFKRVITEADITGKVDVFAGALVIMFLYEKVHVLQRLITGGKTSYTDISIDQRMDLQMVLVRMLATEPDFISHSVIPDKCDIDMRELLRHMTQYEHQSRYSAQDVIDFIDGRERRVAEAVKECKLRIRLQNKEKERMRVQEPVNLVPNVVGINPAVPEIAYNCMELDNGPIRTQTKDKLREKLRPYGGKGKGKFVKEESAMQEMIRIKAASKPEEEDFQPPRTPVTDVSVSMGKLNMMMDGNTSERNAPVTQPSSEEAHQGYPHKFGASRQMDLHHTQTVTQPSASKYHVQPTLQPICPPFGQQPRIQQPVGDYEASRISLVPETRIANAAMTVEQKNQARQEILKHLWMTGQLKIAPGRNGQRIVQICDGDRSTAPTKKGVVPFNPASPLQSSDDDTTADVGNVPDFMKLC